MYLECYLLHTYMYGWCHAKLLPFQCAFCVHHTSMHLLQFTVLFNARYIHLVFRCMLGHVCSLLFQSSTQLQDLQHAYVIILHAYTHGWTSVYIESLRRILTLEKSRGRRKMLNLLQSPIHVVTTLGCTLLGFSEQVLWYCNTINVML